MDSTESSFVETSSEGETLSIPIIAANEQWRIEIPTIELQTPKLDEFKEIYNSHFGTTNVHINFVGIKAGKGDCFVSVLKNPISIDRNTKVGSRLYMGPSYKALLMDSNGYELFYINNCILKGPDDDRLQVFANFLTSRCFKKDLVFYPISQKNYVRDFMKFERHFSRRIRQMKIAVLYVLPEQSDIKEIFKNQPLEIGKGYKFWEFMDMIGKRINMATWQGYRGDMGISGDDVENDSYYTEWITPNGYTIELMFHLAPFMNSEQHRRLIGNDIGVIIYFDNDKPGENQLRLFNAEDVGIMPHILSVVERHPTERLYRLAFFNRSNVSSYNPSCPPTHSYFSPTEMRNFLFTKLHNGISTAYHVPPLNRLFVEPRREAIRELALECTKKGRTEQIKSPRENPNQRILKVVLKAGRDLVSRDSNGLSDPYVIIQVNQQRWKSQIIKKSLNPVWEEEYHFILTEVDFDLDEFSIFCMDKDQLSDDYMGEYHTFLKDLATEPVWLPLHSTTSEWVSGEIQIECVWVEDRVPTKKDMSYCSLPSMLSLKGHFADHTEIGHMSVGAKSKQSHKGQITPRKKEIVAANFQISFSNDNLNPKEEEEAPKSPLTDMGSPCTPRKWAYVPNKTEKGKKFSSALDILETPEKRGFQSWKSSEKERIYNYGTIQKKDKESYLGSKSLKLAREIPKLEIARAIDGERLEDGFNPKTVREYRKDTKRSILRTLSVGGTDTFSMAKNIF